MCIGMDYSNGESLHFMERRVSFHFLEANGESISTNSSIPKLATKSSMLMLVKFILEKYKQIDENIGK